MYELTKDQQMLISNAIEEENGSLVLDLMWNILNPDFVNPKYLPLTEDLEEQSRVNWHSLAFTYGAQPHLLQAASKILAQIYDPNMMSLDDPAVIAFKNQFMDLKNNAILCDLLFSNDSNNKKGSLLAIHIVKHLWLNQQILPISALALRCKELGKDQLINSLMLHVKQWTDNLEKTNLNYITTQADELPQGPKLSLNTEGFIGKKSLRYQLAKPKITQPTIDIDLIVCTLYSLVSDDKIRDRFKDEINSTRADSCKGNPVTEQEYNDHINGMLKSGKCSDLAMQVYNEGQSENKKGFTK
ncbi:MAG: hypothetical protein WC748_09720 [Legionellales bacterium]|jgi:hypothetical protein